ncbi:MAG: TonB family protein [Myxococcota bacterium]|nr:TonB family protein [Myxococcota bacterium]
MLRITTTKEKFSLIWIPVCLVTVSLHLGLFFAGISWTDDNPQVPYDSSQIAFRTIPSVPKPTLQPEIAPEEIALPTPEKKQQIKTVKEKGRLKPKPNNSKPAPQPEQLPDVPVKPVFGVTANSVTNGNSGVAVVRVGNTLAKEMETAFTKPQDVSALPPTPNGPRIDPHPVKKEKKSIVPIPVYELSQVPTFKSRVEPQYPDQARRDGIEGTVQLEILIDENGRVRKVKVIKTPGYGLEKAAIVAVSKSRFNPGVINGKAVPVKIKIPYKFMLDV